MRLADALVEALKCLDVRYVFGVSGANIEHVHDAIHRRGEGRMRSVLAKSEAGAAFMADGHARVHGTLSVCVSTSGGGMVNLIAGLAESFQSSTPVLAIVGQPPTAYRGRGAFQDSSGVGRSVNAVGLLGSMTKFTKELTRAEEFWPALESAVIAALSDRKGPSALLVPRDLFDQEVEPPPLAWGVKVVQRVTAKPAARDRITRAIELLRSSRKPMLLVGQGARRSVNPNAVRTFAERTAIPVATTMSARAEYPNDAPNYLGVFGAAGHPSVVRYLCDEADLLLVAGASLNIMTCAPLLREQRGLAGKQLVVISTDLDDVERSVASFPAGNAADSRLPNSTFGVEADVGLAFEALNELWSQAPFSFRRHGVERLTFSPSLTEAVPVPGQPLSEILLSEALEVISRHLPESGHLFYDAGNCAAAALHYVSVPRGVSATIALGMGGMGYAIGGAIGAQLGSPAGTRTLVFAGDGAFLISGLEAHTAVELNLPILYIVFNNSMHGMCVTRQQLYFEARIESSTYGYVDVAQVARGLAPADRLWARKATTLPELRSALDEYAKLGPRPGVLEIVTAREELPPFSPFLPTDAPTRPQSS